MGPRGKPRVLLIGWDAADWAVINPLMDRGEMPHLAAFVEQGVMGNIATLNPPLSPLLWTSIATGKLAHKHGILGFVEPSPDEAGVRPVSSTSRKCRALWNILTQSGMKSNVVAWYASHPAEPIHGACVSSLFRHSTAPFGKEWPLIAGSVHPTRLVEALAELRVHPAEITADVLQEFIPNLREIDPLADSRPSWLAKDIAESLTVQAITTWLMENEPWDFSAVYFETIDKICHRFMEYHPPRMAHIPEKDFDLYRNVVEATYRLHDMMLGRLLELAGPETVVVLCSDHGYQSGRLRPAWTPNITSGPVMWHRHYGILAMRGPGIKRDERIYGARILDIAPTILKVMGLPVGRDMDGRVLLEAFETPELPQVIPSWEEVDGNCGMHPSAQRLDPWHSQEMMKQLAALGYIPPISEDLGKYLDDVRFENRFNLARSLLSSGIAGQAAEILEELYAERPENLLAGLSLATACYQTDQLSRGRQIATELLARSQDPAQPAFGRPMGDEAAGRSGTEGPRLIPHAELLLGMLDLEENKPAAALEHLAMAAQSGSLQHQAQTQLGRAYLKLKRWNEAEAAFQAALAIDPDHHQAHDGLSETYLGLRRNEDAAEEALNAVGLIHHYAPGHFHLGVALARLGMWDRALQAFQVSLAINGKKSNPSARWLRRLSKLQALQAATAQS